MAVEDYLITVDGSEGWQEMSGQSYLSRYIPITSHLTDFAAQGNGITNVWVFSGNYGIDSPYDTGIQISAGDRVTIAVNGKWTTGEWHSYWDSGGVDGNSSYTAGDENFKAYSVIGRIGTSNPWFYIGGGVSFPAETSGTLYWAINAPQTPDFEQSRFWTQVIINNDSLIVPEAENKAVVINDGDVYAIGSIEEDFSTRGMFDPYPSRIALNTECKGSVTLFSAGKGDEPDHEGPIDHPFVSATDSSEERLGISLRAGEKRLKETDLSVGTPGGELTFTRSYRQLPTEDYPEDNTDLVMGLGWTHNHNIRLLVSDGAVTMPSGGKAYYNRGGSLLDFEYDDGLDQYILTAVDQSTFVFDGDGKLLSRSWVDGQTWTYTYTGDKLTEVDDGYGRKLCLAYYSTGDIKDGQLWQVGDHQTTNLGTAAPTGRYVEFDYISEKLDGQVTQDPRVWLWSIKDSQGETWTYRYYGQEDGEDNPGLTGFLIARHSPDVDLIGDGTAESPITLEALDYTLEDIEIDLGSDEMSDEDWTGILYQEPQTNEQLDLGEPIGYVRDVVTDAGWQGIQSKEFHLVPGRAYHVEAMVNPFTDSVEMSVAGESIQTSGTGAWESLSLQFAIPKNFWGWSDRLSFITPNGPTQFQVGQVSITEAPTRPMAVTQRLGMVDDNAPLLETDFEFRPLGKNDTIEIQAGRTTTHYFAKGLYVGTRNPAGEATARSGAGTQPTALVDGRANLTQMVWINNRLFKVIDPLENENMVRHDSQGRLTQVGDAKGRKTHYFYDHAATPNLPSAKIIAERDLIVNGDMEEESWEKIGSPTAYHTRTYVDDGLYTHWVYANEVGEGIQSQPFDISSRMTIIIARVQVGSNSTVKMGLSGASGFDVLSTKTLEYETLVSFIPSSSLQDQTLQFTLVSSTSSWFLVDSVSVLTDIVDWRAFTYVDIDGQYHLQQEDRLDPDDSTTVLSQTEYTYYQTGTQKGLLETVARKDMVGSEADIVTTYDYDDFGRLIQTDKTTTVDGYENIRFVYDDAGNVVAEIVNYDAVNPPETADDAEGLYNASKPDKNHVTTYRYNSLGWLVETTTMAGSPYAVTSLMAYDALGRVIRTIENYIESVGVSNPYVADREDFDHGTGNDQNLVIDTTYNERGLVRTQTDVLGNVTLYGYNEADRLVRLVRNASQPGYDNSYDYDGDPALADYLELSEEADQDIITEREYDAAGNPVKRVDPNGDTTFMAYDALNRLIKRVERAKSEATLEFELGDDDYDEANDPRSANYAASTALDHDIVTQWEYDEVGDITRLIDPLDRATVFTPEWRRAEICRNATTSGWSDNPDEDLITEQYYDNLGRLGILRDMSKGRYVEYEYDGFDRVKASTTNPDEDQGPDRNLATQTVYNDQGQVRYTTDPIGRKTWYVYDSLGRVVKTIVNCTYDSGSPAPEDSTYVGSSDTDKDLISWINYHPQVDLKLKDPRTVHVLVETGPLGNKTVHQLDWLGREVCTIQNFSNGVYSDDQPDQDRSTWYFYDLAGRLVKLLDLPLVETCFEYDRAGRQTAVIHNHKSGGTQVDQNVTERAEYDKAGRLIATSNPWKIRTTYEYGAQDRVQAITRAAGSSLSVTDWVCYDRAGQILRTIQASTYNPDNDAYSPIHYDGDWLYKPEWNGTENDRDLVTNYSRDKRGRPLTITDPMRNQTFFTYACGNSPYGYKLEPPLTVTDPAFNVTRYVYDELSRVRYTVRKIVPNEDSDDNYTDSRLYWDTTNERWQLHALPAEHGTDNDQNIITEIEYDEAGRQVAVRDPNGHRTAFAYDDLDRQTSMTDPLSHTWQTSYEHRSGGAGLRVRQTNPNSHQTTMDFDLLGRPHSIAYLAGSTPDISFHYDRAGNRSEMVETINYGTKVRQTSYFYDGLHRPTSALLDTDGDGGYNKRIDYTYNENGLLRQISPSNGVEVNYSYDALNRVKYLFAGGSQGTNFSYDLAGRLKRVERSGGVTNDYAHDPHGRLLAIEHTGPDGLLGRFSYQYDVLGNLKAGYEYMPSAGIPVEIVIDANSSIPVETGNWSVVGSFKETTNFSAKLELDVSPGNYILTLGTGPGHGICHVYLVKDRWIREDIRVAEWELDNYSATPGERSIDIPSSGNYTLVIENTTGRNIVSDPKGHKLRFKQLAALSTRAARQVTYEYDGQSRLRYASYADPSIANDAHNFAYEYDYAGNLIGRMDVWEGDGLVHTSTYNLDAANRIDTATIDGQFTDYTYDDAGQMTLAGTTAYNWDRAGRLLGAGSVDYTYDGDGRRVQMSYDSTPTDYLVNPLTGQMLATTTNGETTKGVFGPTGLHAQLDDNTWKYPLVDGRGSIRALANPQGEIIEGRWYNPHGSMFGGFSVESDYGFGGALADPNGLLYPGAASYYDPTAARPLSVWGPLGPFPALHWGARLTFSKKQRERYEVAWGHALATLVYGVGNTLTFGAFDDVYYGAVEKDWSRFGAGVLTLIPFAAHAIKLAKGLKAAGRAYRVGEIGNIEQARQIIRLYTQASYSSSVANIFFRQGDELGDALMGGALITKGIEEDNYTMVGFGILGIASLRGVKFAPDLEGGRAAKFVSGEEPSLPVPPSRITGSEPRIPMICEISPNAETFYVKELRQEFEILLAHRTLTKGYSGDYVVRLADEYLTAGRYVGDPVRAIMYHHPPRLTIMDTPRIVAARWASVGDSNIITPIRIVLPGDSVGQLTRLERIDFGGNPSSWGEAHLLLHWLQPRLQANLWSPVQSRWITSNAIVPETRLGTRYTPLVSYMSSFIENRGITDYLNISPEYYTWPL